MRYSLSAKAAAITAIIVLILTVFIVRAYFSQHAQLSWLTICERELCSVKEQRAASTFSEVERTGGSEAEAPSHRAGRHPGGERSGVTHVRDEVRAWRQGEREDRDPCDSWNGGLFLPRVRREAESLFPESGHDRVFFEELMREMAQTCCHLASQDREISGGGARELYSLCMKLFNPGTVSGITGTAFFRECRSAFLDEAQHICAWHTFSESEERSTIRHYLLKRLDNASREEAVDIVHALGIVGEKADIPALMPYTDSWFAGVREAALVARGRLGDSRVIEQLGRLLHSTPALPAWEAEKYIVALGRTGGRSAMKLLIDFMENGEVIPAYDACIALEKLTGRDKPEYSLEEFSRLRRAIVAEWREWARDNPVK